MANRKKPNNLHVLNGTYRKDRHRGKKASQVSPPHKPEWLSDLAGREWDRITSGRAKVYLDESHQGMLAAYCELFAEFSENPRDFPATKMSQFRLISGELALTPDKMDKFKDDGEEENDFSEF